MHWDDLSRVATGCPSQRSDMTASSFSPRNNNLGSADIKRGGRPRRPGNRRLTVVAKVSLERYISRDT
jgi:hypothetical protein